MRVLTSRLIVMMMLAAPAHAQQTIAHVQRRHAQAQRPPTYVIPGLLAPRDPPPHFTIAPRRGATAPFAMPRVPTGLLPQIAQQSPRRTREHGRRLRYGTWYSSPMMVLYVPQPVAVPAPPPEAAPTPVEMQPGLGRLILDVEPASAQVFADGYYIGAPEDFSGARGGGLLEAGLHRIDVNAAGFETMTLDVRVTSNQPVTVRGALKALPPPVALAPTTFYLIAGCYMGNIPPQEARLPASCDLSRTTTWVP